MAGGGSLGTRACKAPCTVGVATTGRRDGSKCLFAAAAAGASRPCLRLHWRPADLRARCASRFAGPNGIAAILARCPEIMLCKPTTNDRWDRRAVELSAYLLRNGHCNVPEVGQGGAWAASGASWCSAASQLPTRLTQACTCQPCRCHKVQQVWVAFVVLLPLYTAGFPFVIPSAPQDWSDNPELGLWVKRQRIARAAGQLRCASNDRRPLQPAGECLPACLPACPSNVLAVVAAHGDPASCPSAPQ